MQTITKHELDGPLISNKVGVISKIVTRDIKWHFIWIKRLIHQEGVSVINIGALNTQNRQRKTDGSSSSLIIVRDFNSLLAAIDGITR